MTIHRNHRWLRGHFLLITLLLLLLSGWFSRWASHAQETLPLSAPFLAANTVEQDAIILYNVASDSYRRLSFGAQAHHVWDFSPDGCRVLLTLSNGTQPARMISANLDGSDVRQMVTFDDLAPERWGVWEPNWSSQGMIAFTMIRDRLRDGVLRRTHHTAFVTPPNTTPQFYSVTGNEFSPIWSPDGEWLAYVSYNERVAGANTFATAIPTLEPLPGQTPAPATLLTEAALWMVSRDASTKYQLTTFPTGSVSQARWSPDGELLSFVYSPSSNNDTLWMIANQQGAIPTQLSYQWVLALDNTWLPDATAVIGALRDFRETPQNTLWQIPLVNSLDDTGATRYLSVQNINHADYPRFSPDGNWLAVRSAYALELINLQTGEQRTLDERVFGNSPVVWSPTTFTGEQGC